jgi:hypothetical protein
MKVTLDPPRLTVNEPGELTVEIVQEGGPGGAVDNVAPVVPPQPDVAIRYIGPSTEVSIVNGRATQRVEHRYAISASKAGTYTIGPITVRKQGVLKEIGSVRLEVLASGAVAGPTEGESAQLSLTLTVPRTEVYLHEHIPMSLALRVGQVRVADLQYPMVGGDGFSIEKLSEPTQRQEQVQGGTVQVVEFTTTLTPLRAGTLALGPATMRLNVLQRERRQDRFFGFFGETRRPTDLHSEPLSLTVLPLPDAGKPASFSGAVGQFQFEVRATPLDPMAGDPVTVTSTVRGQGNLDTLNPPAIVGTDALRVYPVQQATGNVPSGNPRIRAGRHPGDGGRGDAPAARAQLLRPERPRVSDGHAAAGRPARTAGHRGPPRDAAAGRAAAGRPRRRDAARPGHRLPQGLAGHAAADRDAALQGRDAVDVPARPGRRVARRDLLGPPEAGAGGSPARAREPRGARGARGDRGGAEAPRRPRRPRV